MSNRDSIIDADRGKVRSGKVGAARADTATARRLKKVSVGTWFILR